MTVDSLPAAGAQLALDGGTGALGDEEETIVTERAVPGDSGLN
jgi:hypothetical protein